MWQGKDKGFVSVGCGADGLIVDMEMIEGGGGGEARWFYVDGVKAERWRHQDTVFCERRDAEASL